MRSVSYVLATLMLVLLAAPAVRAADDEEKKAVKIEITSPEDKATGLKRPNLVEGFIRGVEKVPEGKELFVGVHPLQATSTWIQQRPTISSKDGRVMFRAQIYLGTPTAGKNEQYEIRAFLAKKGAFKPNDEIESVPEDAVASDPVLVERGND